MQSHSVTVPPLEDCHKALSQLTEAVHVNAICNNTPAGDGVHAMFLTSAGKGGGGGGVSAGTDSVL